MKSVTPRTVICEMLIAQLSDCVFQFLPTALETKRTSLNLSSSLELASFKFVFSITMLLAVSPTCHGVGKYIWT